MFDQYTVLAVVCMPIVMVNVFDVTILKYKTTYTTKIMRHWKFRQNIPYL